jgi:hypothetical protein
MAFDMGFDFRGTVGLVTDPAFAVFVDTADAYPHTYTNSNGFSLNAGWTVQPGADDVSALNDPRIAGEHRSSVPITFRADLGSGSAPGAGVYTIDLAAGSGAIGHTQDSKLFDDVTVLIDLTNGGAGIPTATGHYLDATVTDIAATTNWTGTTVQKTFATTTVNFTLAVDNLGVSSDIAHFRLTPVGGGGAATFGKIWSPLLISFPTLLT